jgi:hypothetical protein
MHFFILLSITKNLTLLLYKYFYIDYDVQVNDKNVEYSQTCLKEHLYIENHCP